MADPELHVVESRPLPELTLADTPAQAPPSAGTWEDRGIAGKVWHPAVKPSTDRADTGGMIGVNHQAVQQRISDWASKLPRHLQRPAAMLAAFPADVLSTLVEQFTSPDVIATAGAKPAIAALDAAPGLAKTAVTEGANLVRRGATTAMNVAEHPVVSSAIGATVGYAHGGPMGAIEGAMAGPPAGRILRIMRKLTEAQETGGPSRLSDVKVPSRQGQTTFQGTPLSAILDEIHADATAGQTGVEAPVAGAVPGGSQAATSTARTLADQPSVAARTRATAPAARPATAAPATIAEEEPWTDLSELFAPTGRPAARPAVRTGPGGQVLRPDFAAGRTSHPVGLQDAFKTTQQIFDAHGIKPSALELDEVLHYAQQGVPADELAEAVIIKHSLKDPVSLIKATTSRGPMSATPGLTASDVEAIGLNPKMKITGLTPEARAYLVQQRAMRHQVHRTGARLDQPMGESPTFAHLPTEPLPTLEGLKPAEQIRLLQERMAKMQASRDTQPPAHSFAHRPAEPPYADVEAMQEQRKLPRREDAIAGNPYR